MQDAEFARRYGPWAVVAGASEGIGESYCRQLARRGLDLVLLARRAGPLEALAKTLRERHGIDTRVVTADLGADDAVDRLRAVTDELDVGLVVYNAARSAIGSYTSQTLEEKLSILDVNCRGVVRMTSHFAPRLVERGRGGLLLMSSLSGLQGAPMLAVYAASKSFITVLGEALWYELRPQGVDVHVCVAGATATPSFLDNTPVDKRRQAFPLEADAVARVGLAALGGPQPTVVPGRINRVAQLVLTRLLPRRSAVSFFGRTSQDMYGERDAPADRPDRAE